MKVLLFNSLSKGGAAHAIRLIIEGLSESIEKPTLVITGESEDINDQGPYKTIQVKTPNLYPLTGTRSQHPLKKVLWHAIDSYNPFFAKRLKQLIRDEKPDIIHTNNIAGFSGYIWKIARRYKIPVVHTIQDYYLLCNRVIMFKEDLCSQQCLPCKLYSVPKKGLSRYVNSVVGISDRILNLHTDAGFCKKASIKTRIYNPVKFQTITRKKKSSSVLNIGFVGLLAPIKGIDYLLRHFSTHIKNSNIVLNIWGQGYISEFEDHLRQTYTADNIRFHGYGTHDTIYNTIDVLIAPARWHEPFGLIVPEANSYGIPVIASDRGAFPELIEQGQNGYIFNLDQPEKLISLINMFAEKPDLTREMEYACIEQAKRYDYRLIANQYLELYRQTLKSF